MALYTKSRVCVVKKQTGSMLLDVIFALWVVVIALLPISALLVGARLLDRQAQIQTVATNAAELEIESIHSQSFANTALMGSGTFVIPPSVLSAFPADSMAGRYVVSPVAGLGDLSHRVVQVAVLVSWTRPDTIGTVSSVRLDSFEAQGAIL